MLCIQRTLANGRLSGFVSGLGAASADAVYGSLVGFGFAALSGALLAHRTGIGVGGGLLLLCLGARTFRAEPATRGEPDADAGSLVRDSGSTFLLTISNPATVLAFVGVFAGLGVGVSGGAGDAFVLVAGVFLGSACWWFLLSAGVSRLRTRVTTTTLRRVNRLAGVVVAAFGAVSLWSAL